MVRVVGVAAVLYNTKAQTAGCTHLHHGTLRLLGRKHCCSSLPLCLAAQILPPPNVTGALHIGHALTVAIEARTCAALAMRKCCSCVHTRGAAGRLCALAAHAG